MVPKVPIEVLYFGALLLYLGAFLVPYVLMLTLVGVPLFFLEISFGQFASLGPITAWTVSPLFKGIYDSF